MYEIYQTQAFILKKKLHKENDERVLIFTKDFGLIWVGASGSKKESSKMRNFLQELSFSNIFLVQGKSGYRLTGGVFISNIFFDLKKEERDIFLKKVKAIKNIFNFLEKILQKSESEEKIFTLLCNFFDDLKKEIKKDRAEELEVIFLSKVFFILGYLSKEDLLEFVEENLVREISEADASEISRTKFSVEEIKNLRIKINENISKIAF